MKLINESTMTSFFNTVDFKTTCSTKHEACHAALIFCKTENDTGNVSESISSCMETISHCKAMGECSLIIQNSKSCFYGPRESLKKCKNKYRKLLELIQLSYP